MQSQPPNSSDKIDSELLEIPELVDEWYDSYDDIKNFLYRYPNGLRVVVSVNPKTVEFDYSMVINGGSYYERQVGVPQGTAHFLEHVLGSPNNLCKTEQELIKYKQGNKDRAAFNSNASTSRKCMYFETHGHYSALMRAVDYMNARILFPLEDLEKFIDKEANIIANEIGRLVKEEKDERLSYEKHTWGETHPEFAERVIGTTESISKITVDDLQKFYEATFVPSNMVMALQVPEMPDVTFWKEVAKIDSTLPNKPFTLSYTTGQLDLPNSPGFFVDERAANVFFSVSFAYTLNYELNYRDERLVGLMKSIFYRAGQDYLRTEKHLVYAIDVTYNSNLFSHRLRGISVEASKEKLLEVLDETYYFLNEYIFEYLDSDRGQDWLNSAISNYIYKVNSEVDEDYAEAIAADVVIAEKDYKFEFEKAKEEVLKMTVIDVKSFITEFLKRKPNFWFSSPYSQEEIEGIFRQSKFYRNSSQ